MAWLGFRCQTPKVEDDSVLDDMYAYADDKEGLFTQGLNQTLPENDLETECSCNLSVTFQKIEDRLGEPEGPSIIVYRHTESFWNVLFRQNIDLLKSNFLLGQLCAPAIVRSPVISSCCC